ncbi:hypothetical protein BKA62DRAFT_776595 [Auriculariales sp. MPI-PUGE-AT-0066]|nr:hypothetical protein BKA62DRAFT_776595 [Auriculariales sp. MPI-PUGE-AT-0066]
MSSLRNLPDRGARHVNNYGSTRNSPGANYGLPSFTFRRVQYLPDVPIHQIAAPQLDDSTTHSVWGTGEDAPVQVIPRGSPPAVPHITVEEHDMYHTQTVAQIQAAEHAQQSGFAEPQNEQFLVYTNIQNPWSGTEVSFSQDNPFQSSFTHEVVPPLAFSSVSANNDGESSHESLPISANLQLPTSVDIRPSNMPTPTIFLFVVVSGQRGRDYHRTYAQLSVSPAHDMADVHARWLRCDADLTDEERMGAHTIWALRRPTASAFECLMNGHLSGLSFIPVGSVSGVASREQLLTRPFDGLYVLDPQHSELSSVLQTHIWWPEHDDMPVYSFVALYPSVAVPRPQSLIASPDVTENLLEDDLMYDEESLFSQPATSSATTLFTATNAAPTAENTTGSIMMNDEQAFPAQLATSTITTAAITAAPAPAAPSADDTSQFPWLTAQIVFNTYPNIQQFMQLERASATLERRLCRAQIYLLLLERFAIQKKGPVTVVEVAPINAPPGFGPWYRVDPKGLLWLLCGVSKSTQKNCITELGQHPQAKSRKLANFVMGELNYIMNVPGPAHQFGE